MACTRLDIKNAVFSASPGFEDVTELTLSNKGIADVGYCSQLTNLANLNLSFNSLTSIAGLATLKSLQSLNVSHNQLSAISSSLTALTHLNASHNKVTSLKAVRGCSNLRDLFLQSNKVEQAELHHLSALTALERLCLAPNPCTKALPPQQYRQAVAGLCPKLQMLDGVHVTAEERAAGSALLSSLSTQQTDVSQAPIHGLTAADITAQHAGTTRREAQASLGGSLSRRQSVGSSSSTGLSRRSSNTGLEQGQARVQAQSMLAPPRSLSLGRGNKTEAVSQQEEEDAQGQQDQGWQGGAVVTPGGSGRDLVALLTGLSTEPSLSAASTASRSRRRRGMPPLGHVPRVKQLPVDSQFQAVLAALPVIDPAKLPNKYIPAQLAESLPRKPPPVKPPADAGVVDYELKYTTGARNVAVSVRRDGSASASWPGGDLAVSVDADHSAGGGAEPLYRMLAMYRTSGNVAVSWDANGGFVQYPNGSLAFSYNSGSGSGTCIAPSGQLLLKWNDMQQGAGSPGAMWSGGVTRSAGQPSQQAGLAGTAGWPLSQPGDLHQGSILLPPPSPGEASCERAGRQPQAEVNDQASRSLLQARSTVSGGVSNPFWQVSAGNTQAAEPMTPAKVDDVLQQPQQKPCQAPIDMPLDTHLGVRYERGSRLLTLYMACEGIQYKFVCGRNLPGAVWETGGTAGSSRGSTTRFGRRAAAKAPEPAEQPAHDSDFPSITSGREVGSHPPPCFLSQLADGSSAGAVRAGIMATLHQEQQQQQAALQDTSPVCAGPAVAEEESLTARSTAGIKAAGAAAVASIRDATDFSSLTAALQALDAGLFERLASS